MKIFQAFQECLNGEISQMRGMDIHISLLLSVGGEERGDSFSKVVRSILSIDIRAVVDVNMVSCCF